MAIAFDNKTSGSSLGTSGSLSHTCTGSDLVLVLFIGAVNTNFVSSVSCNGRPMTLAVNGIVGSGPGGIFGQSAWYIVGPDVGTNTIAVSFSSDPGQRWFMDAHSYTGANDIDGAAHGTSAFFYHDTVTLTTSSANSWIATCITVNSASAGITAPTGYATRQPEAPIAGNSVMSADSNGTVSTGSHSITWNWVDSVGASSVAVGIKEGHQPSRANPLYFAGD